MESYAIAKKWFLLFVLGAGVDGGCLISLILFAFRGCEQCGAFWVEGCYGIAVGTFLIVVLFSGFAHCCMLIGSPATPRWWPIRRPLLCETYYYTWILKQKQLTDDVQRFTLWFILTTLLPLSFFFYHSTAERLQEAAVVRFIFILTLYVAYLLLTHSLIHIKLSPHPSPAVTRVLQEFTPHN